MQVFLNRNFKGQHILGVFINCLGIASFIWIGTAKFHYWCNLKIFKLFSGIFCKPKESPKWVKYLFVINFNKVCFHSKIWAFSFLTLTSLLRLDDEVLEGPWNQAVHVCIPLHLHPLRRHCHPNRHPRCCMQIGVARGTACRLFRESWIQQLHVHIHNGACKLYMRKTM